MELNDIIDDTRYPIMDTEFRQKSRDTLAETGVLVMRQFLKPEAIDRVRCEGEDLRGQAYFCRQEHTVYLSPPTPEYADDHPANRMVTSSKGCITDDVVPSTSPLRTLYDSDLFQSFLCDVLDETTLFAYADPLSSINLHYADPGQELGWHFDNSSFAITLMIQEPEQGGAFEYIGGMRDADTGEMNFDGVRQVLDGELPVQQLQMDAGALVLFRGRNAIHRVAPVQGNKTRMLVVLAYNSEPGISLAESARMTFYGRLN
jgi:hypothetical protein